VAVGRAKSEIDTIALGEEWLTLHPEQRGEYNLKDNEYLAWLLRAGGPFEEIKKDEYHFSDYSTLVLE
jgi:hypothetical protein